jgi:hypothetical protein
MSGLLNADFQARYEPNLAAGQAESTLMIGYMQRGLWLMSSVDQNGAVYDQSNQARTLTNANAVTFGYTGLAPYSAYNGVNQCLWRADEAGLRITDGLTMVAWVYNRAWTAPFGNTVFAKDDAAANRSYGISISNLGVPACYIFAPVTLVFSTVTHSLDTWYFVAGRFIPNTEIAIWSDLTKTTNVVAIPAAIAANASPFQLGGIVGSGSWMNGFISLAGLYAGAWSDTQIENLFQQTRSLFGK